MNNQQQVKKTKKGVGGFVAGFLIFLIIAAGAVIAFLIGNQHLIYNTKNANLDKYLTYGSYGGFGLAGLVFLITIIVFASKNKNKKPLSDTTHETKVSEVPQTNQPQQPTQIKEAQITTTSNQSASTQTQVASERVVTSSQYVVEQKTANVSDENGVIITYERATKEEPIELKDLATKYNKLFTEVNNYKKRIAQYDNYRAVVPYLNQTIELCGLDVFEEVKTEDVLKKYNSLELNYKRAKLQCLMIDLRDIEKTFEKSEKYSKLHDRTTNYINDLKNKFDTGFFNQLRTTKLGINDAILEYTALKLQKYIIDAEEMILGQPKTLIVAEAENAITNGRNALLANRVTVMREATAALDSVCARFIKKQIR